jgi:hypothetical protein
MTVDQIPQYANLLKQLLLFQGFNDAQIAHVVTRFRPLRLESEKLVFAQGTPGENFYIVFEGKVQVVRQERDSERLISILGVGEYFGEEALLFGTPRSATVTTLEPTVLLVLDRPGFQRLMEEYPPLQYSLTVTAESRHLAQKSNFDWLGDEEVVYLVTRRHELFLFTSLLLPVFLGIASIPLLAYGISTQAATIYQKAAVFLGAFGLMGSIVWAVWRGIDWGNDYYIVTNQRVLWLEKVIFLYNSRREAPLTQILAVNVSKTWFGRLLGYGDVEVRTFTGGIRMRKAAKPDLFAVFVEGFKARANFLLRQAEIESIRTSLRERMGLPVENPAQPPLLMRPGFRSRKRNQIKPGSLKDILDTLFKVRYEQGSVITYRKHWLLLLGKTWIPTLLMLMLAAFAMYQMRNYVMDVPSFFATWPMFLLYMVAFLALFIWWIYNYLDWSNDIYQLAPEQIRDIERKPLGDEIKKTAPLESILSLEHARDGIIQLIFNYGNVVINVGETRFIFRGVFNPDEVHQDVSDYIEALNRRKREIELARERERMLNWLITYKDQSDLLRELEGEADWGLFSA